MSSDPTTPTRKFRLPAQATESLGLLAVLAVLILVFSIAGKNFFSSATLKQIANEIPALAVISVGMTFVIITAGIDLSVGSVMAFSGAILGLAMADWEFPLIAALPLAIFAGFLCGAANGWVSVRFAVPSFIVTLGMLQIGRGLAYLCTNSQTKYIGSPIAWLGTGIPGIGLSWAFVFAVLIVILGQVILTRTVFGRYVLVVGANEEAAIYSGIRTKPVKIAVFMIAGALAGLASAFESSRMENVDPNAGTGLELSAIAAVVIGGTSLMGGRGSVVGSFIGVLIMATLGAGLAQVGASDPVKLLITGLVIVFAVIIDAWRAGKLKRSKK
ncbi:MAG: ABC transporter permease [Verrucomicrobiales bacterium]|nr:ABC transporter permease [Verrucomicrobiales bacterium]